VGDDDDVDDLDKMWRVNAVVKVRMISFHKCEGLRDTINFRMQERTQ
jgi:hypothetical protein